MADPVSKPRAPAGTSDWGFSHGNSQNITHHSAKLMGIGGYGPAYDERYDYPIHSRHAKLAHYFMSSIPHGRSQEPLYHGFQNTKGINWQVGDKLKLPLTATSGSFDTSAGYGTSLEKMYQRGEPTVFEFPAGTPMHGYNSLKAADAKEFGHKWAEALTAGEFKVAAVRQHLHAGHWQHGHPDPDRPGATTAIEPTLRVVSLVPHRIFDPARGWVKP